MQILIKNGYNTSKNFAKIDSYSSELEIFRSMKPLTSFSPTSLTPAPSKDNLKQVAQTLAQLNFEYFQGFHMICQSY